MSNGAVEGIGVLERAVELTKAGISFVMATVVWRQGPSSGQRGSRAIVTADGAIYGWIGGACAEPVLIREAKAVLRDGEAKLIWLGQDSDFLGLHIPEGVVTIPISCQSDGALQIFIEPVKVSPQLLIVGRSPMALTLSNLAQDLDWSVEIVDGDDLTASMVRPSSVVVIATQGHGDEDALEIALENNPRFVGLVASSKRGAVVLEYLVDRGLSPDKLKKIKVPVGLDLGSTTHREMAVSILAELVQLRASGEFSKPVDSKIALTMVEDVIDLVCGMSIAPTKANNPFVFEDTTYYFCASGCRSSFEKDPHSFLNKVAR
jgi:xanthine dehydrogenase accessory factor